MNRSGAAVNRLLDLLEIERGDVVYLQSSFSRLKFLNTAPEAILTFILERLGPAGTLVLPSFAWHVVPEARPWVGYAKYFRDRPVFDVRNTPANIGLLPEVFRRMPRTLRSTHCCWSVSAVGQLSEVITSGHSVHPYSPESSFGLLATSGCQMVGLGVTLNTTSLAPVVDFTLGPAHTQQVFTPQPELGPVINHEGHVVQMATYWLLPEVVRTIKPSVLFELDDGLKRATRRADQGDAIMFSYPYKIYHDAAIAVGRESIAREDRMPWLVNYPTRAETQAP